MEGVFYNPMWAPGSSAANDVGDLQATSLTTPAEPEKLLAMNATRKMYTAEQWLELKPIVKQLYIDEGRTFPKVAEYLHEHHDFSPT